MKLPPQKLTASVPTFAMGDIAFLLLIFFVILARAQDDSHIQWQPARNSGTSKWPQPRPRQCHHRHRHSKPISTARRHRRGDSDRPTPTILGDAPAGQRNVFLKVHREAQANHFEPVIAAISEAGGELIHILEPEEHPTTMRSNPNPPPDAVPSPAPAPTCANLRNNSRATVEELQAFLRELKGKSPQEMLGVVAGSQLFRAHPLHALILSPAILPSSRSSPISSARHPPKP